MLFKPKNQKKKIFLCFLLKIFGSFLLFIKTNAPQEEPKKKLESLHVRPLFSFHFENLNHFIDDPIGFQKSQDLKETKNLPQEFLEKKESLSLKKMKKKSFLKKFKNIPLLSSQFHVEDLFSQEEKNATPFFSLPSMKKIFFLRKNKSFWNYRSILQLYETPWQTERTNVSVVESPIALFSPSYSDKKGIDLGCEDVLDLHIPAFKNPFSNLLFGLSVTLCLASRNRQLKTTFQQTILINLLAALKARMHLQSESSTVRLSVQDFNPVLQQKTTPLFSQERISFKKRLSCKDVLERGFSTSQSPSINQLGELTILSCWTVDILQRYFDKKVELLHLKLWTRFLVRRMETLMIPENGASFNDYYNRIQQNYFLKRSYKGLVM